MKRNTPRLILISTALATACAFIVPAVFAQNDASTKKGANADIIAQYDENGNGRLDPDEAAKLREDQAKNGGKHGKKGGKGKKKHTKGG